VELIVAVTILGLLSTLVVPLAAYKVKRDKERDLRYALREMRSAIDRYKDASDRGLIQVKLGSEGYPPDLETQALTALTGELLTEARRGVHLAHLACMDTELEAWESPEAKEKLRLVTSVLVLPYRNPVLTAKMVASLDVLSGGRVTLGVGVGWLKEEFEALDSPEFDRRGAVTDEWITIFKQLWSQSPASFTGQFYAYDDIRAEPFPLQKPHPPIWVGGHSKAALRRTARHGDGWHPVGAIAASPLPPQEMRAHLDTLKRMTEAEGRDFAALTISYKAPLYDTGIPDRDGTRRSFSGKRARFLSADLKEDAVRPRAHKEHVIRFLGLNRIEQEFGTLFRSPNLTLREHVYLFWREESFNVRFSVHDDLHSNAIISGWIEACVRYAP